MLKLKKSAINNVSHLNEYLEKKKKDEEEEKKKKQKQQTSGGLSLKSSAVKDIAPVVSSKTEDSTWFKKSNYFDDGWQFGDVTKTILGTVADAGEDLLKGGIGGIEKALDTALALGNAMNTVNIGQANLNLMSSPYAFTKKGKEIAPGLVATNNALLKEAEKTTVKYIDKDLLKEEDIAKAIISAPIKEHTGMDIESASVAGKKLDATVESIGNSLVSKLIGTVFGGGAGTAYVGLTAAGGALEEALKEGAKYEGAVANGIITAAAEMAGGLFFNGVQIGGHTLTEGAVRKLASAVSGSTLQTLAKWGINTAGEGAEEVISDLMSSIGKKLTYMNEKDFNEIFSVRDAWDSFIGGMAAGGLFEGVDVAVNKIKGTNYVTGLTKTEQKVFEKEVENRIAEEEKDGKKLSNGEKTKIREKVMQDIDKGYISTDTIESVLGGDEYESYKKVIEARNKYESLTNKETSMLQEEYKNLQEEYNELNGLDLTKAKLGDHNRQTEIKDRMAEIEAKIEKNNLSLEEFKKDSILSDKKKSISKNVFDIVKDSRLAESYYEADRQNYKFQADVSKYKNENARKTVQSAIDSGLLNNKNTTHEFVDMVAKISADKGMSFDFVDNKKIQETGFAVEGKTVNGYKTDEGNIAVNIKAKKALNVVVGHEITHILEGTEFYSELQQVVENYAKAKGEYDTRYQALSKMYEGVYDAENFDESIKEELTADMVGEYLFTDAEFVNRLSTEKPNLFKRIYDEIKYLCKVATAGSKEARELEKVKKAFEKAYRESAKSIDTKLSISGVNSKIADKSLLSKAEQLLGSGVDSETVRQKTGWYKGYDGQWRFEIDDSKFEFHPDGKVVTPEIQRIRELKKRLDNNTLTKDEFEELQSLYQDVNLTDVYPITLGGMVEHKELFESYPQLENIRLSFVDLGEHTDGLYDLQRKTIKLNSKLESDNGKLKTALIHEIQHAIQDIEGFANGSSVEYWKEQRADIVNTLGGARRNLDLWLDDIGYSEFTKESMQEVVDKKKTIEEHWADCKNFKENSKYAEQIANCEREIAEYQQQYDEITNGMTAYEQYRNTAGEIEAVDAENRLTLNTEQRRSKRPDIDRENVVFADTRYSISADSEGNKLTEGQSEYFKDSKAVDENGNLLKVYHTTNNDFTVFDKARKGEATQDSNTYLGFFFSDDAEFMQNFPEFEGGKTESYYLDMKNPIDMTNISEEAFLDIVEVLGGDVEEAAEVYHEARYNDSSLQLGHLLIDLTGEFSYNDFIKELKPHYDGLMAKGYDGVIGYMDEGYGVKEYIVLDSHQAKLTSNKNPTADADIRYSLSEDNQGKKLSEEQREYFKNSKAVDGNGNLKVVYHGTRNADFTVFKRNVTYFTDSKEMADSYSPKGDMFEGYVNITKPYEIDAKGEKWSRIPIDNDTVKFLKEYGASVFKEGGKWCTTPADIASAIEEAVDNGELDYDGIIIKNIDDTGSYYKGKDKHLATDYIVFNSNQFKNADNLKPTPDKDIRYSLSEDSKGRKLSEEQKEFFKDSKIRVSEVDGWKNTITPNGALFPVYHGTNSDEFYEFDKRTIGSANDVGWYGKGFYFAFDEREARYYGKQVLECYLNVKKPFFFSEEMQSFDGQNSGDVNFDFASFVINLSEKFPEIAKRTFVEVAEHNSDEVTDKSFVDFAKEIKEIYNSERLNVREVEDNGETTYQYLYSNDVDNMKISEGIKSLIKKYYIDSVWSAEYYKDKGIISNDDFNEILELFEKYGESQFRDEWIRGKFTDIEYAKKNRLSAVITYLANRKYSYINQHMPEYYMENYVGDDFSQELRKKGYDGILQSKYGDEIVVFDSNQIKLTNNAKPTSSPDIRYSLSDPNETPERKYGEIYGEDVRYQPTEDVAPVKSTVSKSEQVAGELVDEADYAPITEEQANAMYEDEREYINSFTDADMPPETNTEYYALEDDIILDDKSLRQLTKSISDSLGLKKGSRTELEKVVQDFSNNKFSSKEELHEEIAERFGTQHYEWVNEHLQEAKDFVKSFKIFVSPIEKSEFGSAKDYVQFMRSNFGKIRISKDGMGVDKVYMSLNEKYPSLFPEDVWNSADQLRRIAEVVNEPTSELVAEPLPDELIDEATDLIYDSVIEYKDTERLSAAEETYNEANAQLLEDTAPLNDTTVKEYAPTKEAAAKPIETVKDRNNAKLENYKTELSNNYEMRKEAVNAYNQQIAKLQAEYDGKKDKYTGVANSILQRIERLKRVRDNTDAQYEKRINDIRSKIDKMNTKEFKTAEQRATKQQEYTAQMEYLIGDTSTWKDKKLGISYEVNTLRRNLRDIIRDEKGNRDIARADEIYEELQGKYNHNEAELNREANRIKKQFADMKLSKAEDTYIQMLGEFRYNPSTTLTEEAVKDYYEKHKRNIDDAKVEEVLKKARPLYDELLVRVNKVLSEQGMKEIPYRKGYFPHFKDDKQGILGKIFNWKTKDNEIPTSIAGLTEMFEPVRSYQSFDKQRKGDDTDYSFSKGLDAYVRGALDWIYHIEDIQKRRAFENHIRYTHSEEGIKAKIEAIYNNEEYDADEAQEQIELVYAEARNPLNNFIQDFHTATNTLAGKKSTFDRDLEQRTNRKVYSVMTNLSNRVTGNMVAGSVSSALTNFIPITQSWVEVSPVSSLVAMKDTIKSTIRDDGTVDKSDFLTNRLKKAENLYKTNWDKASEALGFLMESIDSFTSQTVWRSKYRENLSSGMSENEAIKNADRFAANVMADRSRGNQPTLFDSKSPLAKIFTAFQLEVNNQYGYMFKDAPQDIKNKSKARLIKGYATAFLGAYAYNALYSTLTGRDAALDPIGIIEDLMRDLGFGGDDEEEKEIAPVDVALNFTNNILEEVPFIGGLLGGGRIPLSSALPYGGIKEAYEGTLQDLSEGNKVALTKEWLNPIYYLAMPMGGGQIRKTQQGLGMFNVDAPIAPYYGKGNIDLNSRPVVENEDGTISTVRSMSFNEDGKEILIPTVVNGKIVSDEEAIEHYHKTGEYLGKFDSVEEAEAYAEQLHKEQEKLYSSKKHKKPVAGSYTDSGNLRFPVDDTLKNRIQAGIFGQYANKNARTYFDEGYAPLKEKQIQEYKDVEMPIEDYWKYRDGLKNLKKQDEKVAYINGLDISEKQKNVLKSYLYDEKGYAEENPEKYAFLEREGIGFLGYKELDEDTQNSWSWAFKNQDKYEHLKENGVYPEEYSTYYIPMLEFEDEDNEAYMWEFDNPEKASLGKVFDSGVKEYRQYSADLYEIKGDPDGKGGTVYGSSKRKKTAYIWSLPIDEGQKMILHRSLYDSKSDKSKYNRKIVDYLNSREDISYDEMNTILRELDFTVDDEGNIDW